jgi:hypothetical protein
MHRVPDELRKVLRNIPSSEKFSYPFDNIN